MTDVFIEFDRQLGKKVFKPDRTKNQSRMSLAANEAVIMKKLVGALRGLWRSSKGKGLDDKVTELKGFLLPSPRPEGRAHEPLEDEADEEADEGRNEGDDEGDDEAGEGPNEGDEENEEQGVDGGGDLEDAPETSSDYDGEPLSEPSHSVLGDQDAPRTAPGPSVVVEASQASSVTSGDDSELNAPTLRLGEGQSSSQDDGDAESDSEDSLHRCSQIKGRGWQGRAMVHFNQVEKAEKVRDEKKRKLTSVEQMLVDVRSDLGLSDSPLWPDYEKWCRTCFAKYGDHVYGHLATLDNFNHWVHHQKSQACDGVGWESYW